MVEHLPSVLQDPGFHLLHFNKTKRTGGTGGEGGGTGEGKGGRGGEGNISFKNAKKVLEARNPASRLPATKSEVILSHARRTWSVLQLFT